MSLAVLACGRPRVCTVCICVAPRTRKVPCGSFYAPYIHFHSFIHALWKHYSHISLLATKPCLALCFGDSGNGLSSTGTDAGDCVSRSFCQCGLERVYRRTRSLEGKTLQLYKPLEWKTPVNFSRVLEIRQQLVVQPWSFGRRESREALVEHGFRGRHPGVHVLLQLSVEMTLELCEAVSPE